MSDRAVFGVVEGALDEAVLRVLGAHVGIQFSQVHVKRGRSRIAEKVRGYHQAATQDAKWIVLVDLDGDDCPLSLLAQFGVPPADESFACRVAIRSIEAWLLADPLNIASFLHLTRAATPWDVEAIQHPKSFLVDIARRSRKRDIRLGIAPPEGGRHFANRRPPLQLDAYRICHEALERSDGSSEFAEPEPLLPWISALDVIYARYGLRRTGSAGM